MSILLITNDFGNITERKKQTNGYKIRSLKIEEMNQKDYMKDYKKDMVKKREFEYFGHLVRRSGTVGAVTEGVMERRPGRGIVFETFEN